MRAKKLRKIILLAISYGTKDKVFQKAKVPMRLVAKVRKEHALAYYSQ